MPRCSRFSARISSGADEREPELAVRRRPPPRARARASSTAASSSTVDAAPVLDLDLDHHLRRCGAGLLGVLLVRLDDPLHELVPDDVLVAEAHEADAVDDAEDVLHLDQAGRLLARQVDLRDVAGDDDLRAEAEPRQEHLHLLGRRCSAPRRG